MKISFFDSNIYIGRSLTGSYGPAVSALELLRAMDDAGVEKALVWHISQKEYNAAEGNRLLSELICNEDRLYGCWTVLPPQSGEMDLGEEFFRKMKEKRIFALRVFPIEHRYILNRIVFGSFMDEVSHRRLPLLISIPRQMETADANWRYIYEFISEFPSITCILCDTGVWGTDRFFRPLLEAYKSVYLDSSLLSIGDGVMEDVVGKYGSNRIVFGSAFPKRSPQSSMLQLIHADITDDQKADIACNNLERLIKEAVL